MPIYTDMGLTPASPLDIDDYSPTFGEYMKAAWDDTVNDNPGTVVPNMAQASEARYGFDLIDAAESGGLVSGLDAFRDIEPLPAMSMDDQKSYIKNEGLEGKLTPSEHYTKEELEFLVRLKHDEIDRRITREQAPAWMAPFGFAAGLAASMTDPINLATSFVPVVGEARVMSMLAKASGPWGRAGVRAAVGAVEGAVGAAIVEPMVAAGKSELQQEYDFADSLMNIVFGAGMGAAMHPLSGAIGDWKRARKGQRQPWEYVPSSNTTESLRMENARSIWKGMQESGSEKLSPEHAEAAAALWDATLRGYAYDTGELVENLYRQYRTEYRGGKVEILRNTEEEYADRLAGDVGTELDGIRTEDESAIQTESVSPQMDTAVHLEVPSRGMEEVIDGHRRIRGLETSILNGQTSEPARYELREITDIIPSHDPETQFAKRTDYPEGVQERPYHSDSGEQEKVLRNAATLDPRYLLNDNPDAVNGPPLVTESGIVLGGNSRTMSMQLAYGRFPERAEGYRNALRQRAAMFGLDPAAVDTFERPVLVRVVPGGEDVADMAVRSRLYNQSQTQGLQAKAEGVSKARLLTVETMDTLATDMEDFDSLREFLASAKSKDFISALVRDGVIEQTQLSRLTDASGKLNDAGKDLVENALRGHIVPDYDVLNATPPAVLNKLDRAIPALARLKTRGEGWNMSGVVTRALRVIASADAEGKDIGIYLGQGDLFQSGPKPAVQALALTFSNATQKEVQLRFTVLADAAEKQARGQTSLFAQTGNTPAREFVRAFMEPVASVDGEAVPSFNPTKNTEHAAIQYAYDHGGKGHSVSTAIEELQKKMSGRKTPTEEKARARELMGELGQFSGVVNIYEPKLGQFFSYKKGDELFQGQARGDQSPIVVRGDELGVPEGAEIKEYRKAAREVYRELQKTPAHREDLGEIRFSGDGFRKMQQAGADKRKWQLVPKLKELVENAEYIRRDELYKARRDGIIAFHWLETDVELDGEPLRVGFNIGEDAQGNKFYNLNHDLEEFRAKKEEALAGLLAHNRGPQTELHQGATAPVETRIPVSDDGVNLYILSESKTAEEPRARVTFGEADAYAVVEFFKAADPSSAPHEMYHIFRRIMSEMYEDPNASEASKERYRNACEFVGAEPGRAWTPEQEEKFARAGERFLLEGVTPTPQMGDVMESFQQWMAEIYGNVERSGLEISDGMREVFSGMMGTAEDGDMNFRYSMGKLLDYRPEAGIDTNIELPADTSPDQAIEEYMADSTARADEAFNALADKPQVQEFFKQEYEADMAAADTVIAEAQTMTEIRQAAAACVMRG